VPFTPSFVALAEEFSDSDRDAAAMVEKYWVEYRIIRHEDPKAELSSEELMALIKGRLKPMAKLGSKLRQVIASVF
jgi:hypothetical protein